jgi:parallel beta-helix repeat protein
VEDNSEIGIDILGEGSLIDRCTVADNGSTASHHGIDITSSALITRSVIRQNAGHGIRGASSATLNIVDNVVEDNTGSGISTFNALVIQNTVQDNGGRGIDASNGCTVRNNAVFSNGLSGIRTFAECVVQSNAVRGNNDTETAGEAGIWASSATLAADNVVGSNGLSNIQVSGSDSVIERNLMARCLVLGSGCTGLLITSGGNFYADNRLSGHNTNLDIAASNTDGGGNVTF